MISIHLMSDCILLFVSDGCGCPFPGIPAEKVNNNKMPSTISTNTPPQIFIRFSSGTVVSGKFIGGPFGKYLRVD